MTPPDLPRSPLALRAHDRPADEPVTLLSCRVYPRSVTRTWETLFDRAAAYEVSESDVRTTLETVRSRHDETDGSEAEDAD